MKSIQFKNAGRISKILIILAIYSGLVKAQDSGIGLGIIVGEPTGLSFKSWLGESRAFDAAAAWTLKGNDSFTIHADYLQHVFKLININKGSLPFYFGIGGRIIFGDENARLGARIPVGANYYFARAPVELFFEIVPILDLFPETHFSLNVAIGGRYYFN